MVSSVAADSPAPVPGPASAMALRRAWPRRAAALLLVVTGTALVANGPLVRGFEARGTQLLVGLITRSTTRSDPARATLYWDLFTPSAHGLTVTPECTAAYTVGPLLIGLGLFARSARLRTGWLVAGALAAAVLLEAVNLARLTLIAWSVDAFGDRAALWWSHTVIGSALSLGSVILAVACALRLAFADRRSGRSPSSPAPPAPPTNEATKEHVDAKQL
jgi:exosortase/archaeosortase family protein